MPRLVCISDTHLVHERTDYPVPDGDVLIHAGDATRRGDADEIERFVEWFAGLPHPHKIFVAGNHDFLFETDPPTAEALLGPDIVYLRDSGVELEGLRFWGSPWQPVFFNWAFNLPRGEPLREKWRLIPQDTDVLITHGPPHLIGDRTARGVDAGCVDLLDEVTNRIRPAAHVFGHIHEGYGRIVRDGLRFLNASSCDLRYRLVNPPLVLDL